jgi:predicted nicotinamide N-methyase
LIAYEIYILFGYMEGSTEGSADRLVICAGKELLLRCDTSAGIGGSLWNAGFLLMEHMQQHATFYEPLIKGKVIIELGSGTGLVGRTLLCARTRARVYLRVDQVSRQQCCSSPQR